MLCKHQVVGSIPSGSTILHPEGWYRDRNDSLRPRIVDPRNDIVNEGSVRRLRLPLGDVARSEDGPEKTSLSDKYKAHEWRRHGSLEPGRHQLFMSFAENDQAHKGF